MNRLSLSLVTIAIVALQPALGFPSRLVGQKIEGRVEKIDNIVPGSMKGLSVVHLTDASGLDREEANRLLRMIRHAGYSPQRKTLRKDEIMVALPNANIKEIQPGARIRLADYVAVGTEWKPEALTNVEVKRIEVIAK